MTSGKIGAPAEAQPSGAGAGLEGAGIEAPNVSKVMIYPPRHVAVVVNSVRAYLFDLEEPYGHTLLVAGDVEKSVERTVKAKPSIVVTGNTMSKKTTKITVTGISKQKITIKMYPEGYIGIIYGKTVAFVIDPAKKTVASLHYTNLIKRIDDYVEKLKAESKVAG